MLPAHCLNTYLVSGLNMDLTLNLKSLEFEAGLSESERDMMFLRSRASALTVCGCAHAGFLCRLSSLTREKLKKVSSSSRQGLNVGILGGGRVGKQLALLLLSLPDFKPSHIQISTLRPDTLREFSKRGVDCYFDNPRLATWADLLFFCILPAHIPQVCAELHSHLPAHCVVYSFTSAVPLQRLQRLLGHTFVIKPQYGFVGHDLVEMWLRHKQVPASLKDEEVLMASCPLSMNSCLSMDQRWVSAVLYTLLNMCTAGGLRSSQTIQLLNELFQTKTSAGILTYQSFVNSSCISALNNSEEPFPWINLIDVQTKQTPLSSYLSGCKLLQDCICALYSQTFNDRPSGKTET